MIYLWQKLNDVKKREIMAQMNKDDVKMIKEIKKIFNAEVILLEVEK
jgi:hypothetical protein